MARNTRFSPGNIAYCVMTRTWGGIDLVKMMRYAAFERVLAEAWDREKSMRVCAYCLMPNHFHRAKGEGMGETARNAESGVERESD